jgi:membrane protease YdiL (CAAX protease family)
MIAVGAMTWWAVGRTGLSRAGWKWGRPRDYLIGWSIAAAIWIPGLLVDVARRATARAPIPGWQVALMLALSISVYPLLGFGEEIAWRGYLLPLLSPMGPRKAIFVVGVAWGIWHWPLLLGELMVEHAAMRMPSAAVMAALAGNLLLSLSCSAIFAWVWSRSKSIAVVAFLHGEYDGIRDTLHFAIADAGHAWVGLGETISSANWGRVTR